MDISALIAGLTAADKAAQASNPYTPFESAATGIGSALLKGAQNYSLPENVIGGLLTGLVGGYSQHLGDDYIKNQNSLARSLLYDAIAGSPAAAVQPEDMAPNVFSVTKNYGDALRAGTILDNQKAIQQGNIDLRNAVTGTVVKGILDNPWKAKVALGMLGGNGETITPGTAAGEAPPANTITPGTPAATLDPSMSYEALMAQNGGNETAVNQILERNRTAPDRARATEDSLASQLLAQKPVQDFVEIGKQYNALQKAYVDKTPVSDLDYTIGIMKILDPTSIVRETEQGQVVDSQALPASLLATINKSLTGGPKLSPEVRQHLLDLADRRYENQKATVAGLVDNYRKIALTRQANPDAISTRIPSFDIRPLSEIVGTNTGPDIPPGMKLQRNAITRETRLVPQ